MVLIIHRSPDLTKVYNKFKNKSCLKLVGLVRRCCILSGEEISNERALELHRKMGNAGLVITTLYTRAETAYILDETLKKAENDFFKIDKQINEVTEKLKGELSDEKNGSISSQIEELKKELDRDKIYRELIEYALNLAYAMFDGKYYKKIKETILSKVEDKKVIYSNMQQLFSAYEKDLYYPCLCGAIPMIERIIKNNENLSDTKLARLFEKIANNIETNDDFEKELHIANLEGFIQYISDYRKFSEDEPTEINRHWILHGRTFCESRKVDCLKVFSAIYSLMELLGDNLQI